MTPAHGTHSRYSNNECRCGPCRAANVVAMTEGRQRRYSRRRLINGWWIYPYGKHGSANSYTNNGCRCGPCRVAMAERNRKYQAKRRAAQR